MTKKITLDSKTTNLLNFTQHLHPCRIDSSPWLSFLNTTGLFDYF